MTRISRCYSNSKIYHIILKGIDKQDIFYKDQDRKVFLKNIMITQKQYEYFLYAYCLMDNHVHMVMKSEKEFLSKSIQSLMIRYVSYFNKKYKRTGPLVQNRFKSQKIEDLMYFLKVCRYVHRNPENAKIAKTEEYQWSSYKEYLEKGKIVDTKVLLHYFNDDINEFIKYTANDGGEERFDDFAEYEMIEKLTDEELSKIIMKIFDINDVNYIPFFFKSRSKEELKEDLQKIAKIKGTNDTQIARVIRIGRWIVKNYKKYKKEPVPNESNKKEPVQN